VLVFGLAPVLYLAVVAFAANPEPPAGPSWRLDARTWGLLARSLAIASGASAGALALGGAIALPLARIRFRGRGALTGGLLAAFAVAPYWMALGWLRGDLASQTAQLWMGRPAAVAFILATAYAPAVALLLLLAARSLPIGWEEAALLTAPLPTVVRRILLPPLLPFLAVVTLLVFSLCFADYEVASLLQVVTYPIEVFLLYASVYAPGEAARACLPLLAVAIVTAAPLGALLSRGLVRQWPASVSGSWPLTRGQRSALLALALTLAAGFSLWPMLGLLSAADATPQTLDALRAGAPALANSLATTAASVLIAIGLGVAASGALVRARPATRALLSMLLLVPVCLPAPAYAIAWVALAAAWPPALRDGLASLPALVPAFCIAARWAGLVALLAAAARLALPRSALDAARLQEGSAVRRFLRVELPLVVPVLLAAAAILSALSQGAIGILVLTVPAGFEVAPLRIDNLLHYGAREQAVALAVASAALAAGIPLALAIAASRAGRRLV